MKAEQIIENAKLWKQFYQTDDPFVYANVLKIDVIFTENFGKKFKAQIVKMGQRTIIYINKAYDALSRKILCAHEIAHYLFHSMEQINYYNNITKVEHARMEYEANLFALVLLLPDDEKYETIWHLNGYLLREIIEANLAFE